MFRYAADKSARAGTGVANANADPSVLRPTDSSDYRYAV
jgi:hypothetical protein|eukprot:COSAG01_NODE_139_length_24311_cov_75.405873_7_plen_39_part_00